jgi:type II secretory pathway pseudopilin PulG
MPKQISRPFTLLEIVIVLMLIGVMAVFGTSSLSDLLAQHRRQAEVDELQNFIQELQIEALALQSDLELSFIKDKDKLHVSSKTAEKILRNRTIVLKGIRELKFQDRIKPDVTLQIFSTGRIEPQGLFEIEREKGSVFIDVRQPLLVKFSSTRPTLIAEVIPDKPKPREKLSCGQAKAPGFNDRQRVHIKNMDLLSIVESRELSLCPHVDFSRGLGLKPKKKEVVCSS